MGFYNKGTNNSISCINQFSILVFELELIKMAAVKSVQITCANIHLHDTGIIELKYHPDREVELMDAIQVESVFLEFSEGKGIYCLMDTTGRLAGYTKEAQTFLAKEASIVKSKQMKCSAVIIDNLPSRMLTSFFMKLFKPKYKVKTFANEEDATSWLKSEIKADQN